MLSDLKNLTFVAGSNVLNSGFGFVSSLLIARSLGQEAFGAVTIFIGFMAVLVEIAGKNTDWATVRFAAKYWEVDPGQGTSYFHVMLIARILLAAVVLLVGNILAGPLAEHVFHKPAYAVLIRYATVASVGASFFFFVLSYFQTTQQFLKFGLLNILGNGFKVIPIALLLMMGTLRLQSVLLAYSLIGFAGALVGFRLLPRGVFVASLHTRQAVDDLRSFGGWLMLGALITAFYCRLDTFMLGYFMDDRSVGLYAAALNIVFAIDMLICSAFTILMPKVSKLTERGQFTAYIRHSLKLSAVIAIPLCGLYVFADTLMIFCYSSQYAASVPIFRILFLGVLVSVMVQPLALLFYAKNRPEVFALRELLLVLVLAFAHPVGIMTYGLRGAAYVTMGARFLQAAVTVGLVGFLIRRSPLRGNSESLQYESGIA